MGHVGLAILAAEQKSIMAGTHMGRFDLAGAPYWGILAQKTEHSLLSFRRIQQFMRHRTQGVYFADRAFVRVWHYYLLPYFHLVVTNSHGRFLVNP
jgi:hypothetical protein